MKTALILITMTIVAAVACNAGEKAGDMNKDNRLLSELVGKPVDIAPWTYAWRADRAVQE